LPTPRYVTQEEAENLHKQLINLYGGSLGLRDVSGLESALLQPQQTFSGVLLHPAIADQAAAYLYHIAKNHPFIDGNKRTALAVAYSSLKANGFNVLVSKDDLYNLVIQIVNNEIDKTAVTEYVKAHVEHVATRKNTC